MEEGRQPAAPPTIILVRPREEGNVGAVARAMANMGLDRLVLVEPATELGGVARGFGVGGWHVLDECQRATSLAAAVAPFRRVVGTTSGRGRELRHWQLLTPRQLATNLAEAETQQDCAIVFGAEDNGLTGEELDLCHPIVSIPSALSRPTLNLAQAVLIIAYELRLASRPETTAKSRAEVDRPEAGEVAGLLAKIGEVLEQIGYDDPTIHRGLVRSLGRLLRRADASRREARLLRRLTNRAYRRLQPRQLE